MPLVDLTLRTGRPDEELRAILDAIHDALVNKYEMHPDDRFQFVHQLRAEDLIFDQDYRGGPRSEGFMLVHITAGERAPDVKRAFMREMVDLLHARAGVAPADVFILLSASKSDDFSFGSGIPAGDVQ